MSGVLVVGASGFVGQSLCAALARGGDDVRGTCRRLTAALPPSVEWVATDDLAKGPLSLALFRGCDTVFHLAGHAHAWADTDSDLHRRVTVDGTRNVVRAAASAGIKRLIYFSSVKAGGEGGSHDAGEAQGDTAFTLYGRAKWEAEQLVLAAGREHGMHVCNLRPAMVYGVGMKGNLPRMIVAIDNGRFPPLPDTKNKRSLVWVEDLVQAALLAARLPAANGKTYNVTDGEAYSTRRISAAVYAALAKPMPQWAVPLPVLCAAAAFGDMAGRLRGRRLGFDSQALEKLLGSAWYSGEPITHELAFRPQARLEQVLPDIVRHLRQQNAWV